VAVLELCAFGVIGRGQQIFQSGLFRPDAGIAQAQQEQAAQQVID